MRAGPSDNSPIYRNNNNATQARGAGLKTLQILLNRCYYCLSARLAGPHSRAIPRELRRFAQRDALSMIRQRDKAAYRQRSAATALTLLGEWREHMICSSGTILSAL